MVRGRYYHSPIASSISLSAPTIPLARVATQPLIRIRPSAPCSEAWRNVAAVFRPPERVLERALPALTPAEAGSLLHRQVSSKARASMLCSLPFSRHTCPRAARCAGKSARCFLVVGHFSAHRAKAAPLSSIKICCEADYANSQTQPFA
jgi:hypothetical protein